MRRLTEALALALMLGGSAGPADALLVDLTDDQVEQAIAQGRETYQRYRHSRQALDDLDPEYVVTGDHDGRALLFTEFGSIVLETRRYLAIGRRFTPNDLTPIIAPLRGRIEFIVVTSGDTREFLRESKISLVDAKTRHEPKIWHVNRGVAKPGAPNEFVASGRYSFDARDIDTSRPVLLVVQRADGRELRFEFDLARLR